MTGLPPCVALACAEAMDCLNGPGVHEFDAMDCCTQPWEALERARCLLCGAKITRWMRQPHLWRGEDWRPACSGLHRPPERPAG